MHSDTCFRFSEKHSTEFLPKGGQIPFRSWRLIGVDLFDYYPVQLPLDEAKHRIRMALFDPVKPLQDISIEISEDEVVAYTTQGKSGCILKWLPR